MKVALLLSGLPRKIEDGYNFTWKHIIENYDTDVYLHAWKDEEWEKVNQIYLNAKSIQIQEPFTFTKYKEGIKLPHNHYSKSRPIPEYLLKSIPHYDVTSCFRQLPMFYSWQMGYKPLHDSMVEYDVVIRSRYDLGVHQSINLNEFNMDLINHHPIGAPFFDDNLCITNKHNSDILFHSVFDNVIKNSRENGILNRAESSWTDILQKSNLIDKSIRHPSLTFSLLRENKLWWADRNKSII